MKATYPFQILVVLLISTTLLQQTSIAQCNDGQYAHSISYDTVFAGGGNDLYPFTFPQFDPSLGTLVKVGIETVITVKYNYQLENTDANPIIYRVRVNRSDDINCSALTAPLSSNLSKTLNTHLLQSSDPFPSAGNDYVEVGPVYAYNNYPINYNVNGQVAGFMGNGQVNFEYASTTDSYPSGSSHYLYRTSATDSISFKLTYYYCNLNFLPADIMNFSATPVSATSVHLTWYTPNDVAGEKYEVEKSVDGKSFSAVQSLVSTRTGGSNYQHTYQAVTEDGTKLFFRIKQYEQGGGIKYTAVRTVVLTTKLAPAMKVYPTVVTDYMRVFFSNIPKDDWTIRVVDMNGRLVQQTDIAKSDYARLSLPGTLNKGIYVVQAENKHSHLQLISRVSVQ